MSEENWTIRSQPIHSWKTHGPQTHMRSFISMEGRITVRELIEYFERNHPEVDPMSVGLNWLSATWERPPTEEEVAERNAWLAKQAERTEAWERKKYEELKVKFGEDA